MTAPFLTLDGVRRVLPDGRTIFTDLTETFDLRPTGLVGRNGVGKSLLARLLAGVDEPTSGRVSRHGRVFYLSQHADLHGDATVATLAGAAPVLSALARIEEGGVDQHDYDIVGDRWDMPRRLRDELERHGLGHLTADTPVSALSGGEATRVALVGAFLSAADILILDEPSNHLDRASRLALAERLSAWSAGLIVVSHDRELLRRMERIVELSESGLRSYGGGYDAYVQLREKERADALALLDHRKAERRREERNLREQRERAERRQARGTKEARQANLPRIQLGLHKNAAERSVAAGNEKRERAREALDERVREAARDVERREAPRMGMVGLDGGPQRVLRMEGVVLPHVRESLRHVDLTVTARQRIGIVGPNGSGKSTLLRVIAGSETQSEGSCESLVPVAWLDQQLRHLDDTRSIVATLLDETRGMDESTLRMRLMQMGLDADAATQSMASLSGGQRLAAGLAHATLRDPPARLLLLDEPGNHLDLPSLDALETMLRDYDGALMVVSHDEVFLERVGLTHRLEATAEGWRLSPA
ncbi:ABC-F family ATP-binding cassette domain-containing protein [Luteibacter sp. CQ10]|uniref:ABC-F family ATP-binding cassette domain-containing protein n=1 Tax=Luteibacter sp. CQ10 TaxID=2805821 RepID=UPI0034A2B70F